MKATRIVLFAAIIAARTAPRVYIEEFDGGPGGWFAYRRYALSVWDGAAYCHGPWFLDANHAPPGAGYLHMVMWLYTHGRRYKVPRREPLPYTNNRFLEGGFPTDFTRARVTVRLRGRVDMKGAQLLLEEVEVLRASKAFVVDACRQGDLDITRGDRAPSRGEALLPSGEQWPRAGIVLPSHRTRKGLPRYHGRAFLQGESHA